MMRRILGLFAVLAATAAGEALACSVCWGGAADSPVIDGTKLSILFMAVLTYVVIGGFVAGFVIIGRRSRAEAVDGEQKPIREEER